MIKLLAIVLLARSLLAQQGGFVSGVVRDRSGGAVPAAEVRIQSEQTGTRQTTYTDAGGRYASGELARGNYQVTVRRSGFRTFAQDVSLIAGKGVRLDFVMNLLPIQQEISVSAARSDVDPTASGLTMSRDAPAANLPQNGRDVHALFGLMPGATVTPASISAGGQFTVSGQRPNANSFWVDGVSGNVGMGVVSVAGAITGSDLPSMTAIGGMQGLASQEETEKVELRAADFTANVGDRPGAQISIETRAGTDALHGSLLGYVRPRALDSQDWFARGVGFELQSSRLTGFGGGLGGPLWRNHTFFFAAFEKDGVHDNALQIISVPSPAVRERAGPYQLLLDAFPNSQGSLLNANEARGYSPLQKEATVTNRSLRLDQAIGNHGQLFARYADVPSSSSAFELGAAYAALHWSTLTVGLNLTTGRSTQEFRFNYSNIAAKSRPVPADTPLADAIREAFASIPGPTRLAIEGIGQTIVGTQLTQTAESQFAGNYGIVKRGEKQELRAGFAYEALNLQDSTAPQGASVSIVSSGIEPLLAGDPLWLTYSTGSVPGATIQRSSAFAQDAVQISTRLNLLFGLRCDFVGSGNGTAIPGYFTGGYWNGMGSAPVFLLGAPVRPSSWSSMYGALAPRFGFAYRLKSPDLVLRAGAGLFYDTGFASIVENTNPLNIWQYLPNSPPPVAPDIPSVPATGGALHLPRVWEWKASLEKSFWKKSLFSISYTGSSGHRLLRDEGMVDSASGILERLKFTSSGVSNYNALLVNLNTNVTQNLFALISYTWGHSIDTGSSDTAPLLADGPSNKGTSSFDVRQVLAASLSYRTPSRLGLILGNWAISGTSFARAGFPFNVTTVDESIGLGFENSDRANLIPGQPVWISNNSVGGGRMLNPAAFQAPTAGVPGTLGRNVLTGGSLFQLDASVRRQVRLFRDISTEVAISAFNVFNHPSFANPVSYLGSALFGQPTNMTSLMLGSGSPTTGLTPLFQAGGPRTIELSLRLSF